MGNSIMTLSRFVMERQRQFPGATGQFTELLGQIMLAGKIISWETNKAGLVNILGMTGKKNIQGELVQKLDEYANDIFYKVLAHSGHLCVMASEEDADIILIPQGYPRGKYVLLFDPLDGSSCIDANVSVGSIFSIHRKLTKGEDGNEVDCLQPGIKQVAAGYIIYGSSTMFVYTTGDGVHGFTLDPAFGEFLLSHENIRIPEKGKIYSTNEGNFDKWPKGTQNYIKYLKQDDPQTRRPYSSRYIGSLVSDFHRNILYGGIFLYPEIRTADETKYRGKLRLLYEAAPLSFVVENAGGLASTGKERILDIQPTEIHQRVPLIIGSKLDVLEYEKFYQQTENDI
ncbi:MAG: fructose-bisphosphatase [Candidatus Schekmanbacteria bacterium RBG_13_48_7]|uniref:Fructose-1,6-bisphosphatase class 1 n=1 Tax=Candidatus Schekmanbacteria bacterium RBG_13_48_7 TaxID=1817878 RepID=A0A1F7S3K6_9BACT|nr:MAG: fructose-bisphosphatase [Candidatus Schekmanbacteria bacterium RBG_13_48_7]